MVTDGSEPEQGMLDMEKEYKMTVKQIQALFEHQGAGALGIWE